MTLPEDKDNDIISQNFLSNRNIFVVSDIASDTSTELITEMFSLVNKIRPTHFLSKKYKIISPYKLPYKDSIALDVYIDSKGGETNTLHQISSILAIAKNKGVIIRTHVYGTVYSSASLLAVQGTLGYRIMGENAFHFVHFGDAYMHATKESEIMKSAKHMLLVKKQDRDTYLANTKLTNKQIDELQADEMGYLDAKSCLKYGLCDWILTNSGKYINHSH